MARVLVDAEKRCDLALAVRTRSSWCCAASAPSSLTVRVTTQRPARRCAGAVRLPAPYVMVVGRQRPGMLSPGQSITRTRRHRLRRGVRPPTDTLAFTLDAPDDAQSATTSPACG